MVVVFLCGETVRAVWQGNQAEVQGVTFSVRQRHAAAEFDDVLFVFGGCSVDAECYTNACALNAETLLWSQDRRCGGTTCR